MNGGVKSMQTIFDAFTLWRNSQVFNVPKQKHVIDEYAMTVWRLPDIEETIRQALLVWQAMLADVLPAKNQHAYRAMLEKSSQLSPLLSMLLNPQARIFIETACKLSFSIDNHQVNIEVRPDLILELNGAILNIDWKTNPQPEREVWQDVSNLLMMLAAAGITREVDYWYINKRGSLAKPPPPMWANTTPYLLPHQPIHLLHVYPHQDLHDPIRGGLRFLDPSKRTKLMYYYNGNVPDLGFTDRTLYDPEQRNTAAEQLRYVLQYLKENKEFIAFWLNSLATTPTPKPKYAEWLYREAKEIGRNMLEQPPPHQLPLWAEG
jgi:hypothetical protein